MTRSLRCLQGTAPLRGECVTVYQPILREARLHASTRGGRFAWLASDDGGLVLMHRALTVAATLPKAIVHVPLSFADSLDLVICHRSRQLPRSAWKEMRRYLRPCEVRTLQVPLHRAEVWPDRYDERDHVYMDVAANTLFVTSGRKGLLRLAEIFRSSMEHRGGGSGYLNGYFLSDSFRRTSDLDELAIERRIGREAWTEEGCSR